MFGVVRRGWEAVVRGEVIIIGGSCGWVTGLKVLFKSINMFSPWRYAHRPFSETVPLKGILWSLWCHKHTVPIPHSTHCPNFFLCCFNFIKNTKPSSHSVAELTNLLLMNIKTSNKTPTKSGVFKLAVNWAFRNMEVAELVASSRQV